MAGNYWNNVLNHRIGRRRAIAAAGGLSTAAALLAACGGSDNGGATGDQSGLITEPEDTTRQARRGGTMKWFVGNEPNNLDVQMDQAPKNQHKNMVYGHFVNERAGLTRTPAFEDVVPEMMESWEWSADGLQLTFKVRQGVKWHNKAPVNGRLMDVDDIIFSWNRYADKGTDRAFLANSANPNAPVLSVTAPDPRTIVFKLKEPFVALLPALTPTQTGKPSIIPRETDSTFDIRVDMIGTGPFMLEKYTPTVGFTYKRNPDYFDKDVPLVDTVEVPIILEYAQALAQFKAGNLYTYASTTSSIRAEDIVPMKRDVPALKMYRNEPSGFAVRALVFGWLPTDANKPFKDERVRQAVSMTWDRDAYIDAFYNVSRFEAEGLPVKSYYNTTLLSGAGSWWLDPLGKDFGPDAKYYKRDIAEARRLLAAAGYASGVDVKSSYIGGTQLGADWQRQVGVCDEFAKEAGFKVSPNIVDYTVEYIPVIRDGHGKYDGWAWRAGGSPANDAVAYFSTLFHSKYGGPGFLGFDAAGKGDGSGDPELEAMLVRSRAERDLEKRRALVWDMQRYLARKAYAIPHEPGVATGFQLAWPALKNYQAFQGDRRGGNATSSVHAWWIDDTQAPLART